MQNYNKNTGIVQNFPTIQENLNQKQADSNQNQVNLHEIQLRLTGKWSNIMAELFFSYPHETFWRRGPAGICFMKIRGRNGFVLISDEICRRSVLAQFTHEQGCMASLCDRQYNDSV